MKLSMLCEAGGGWEKFPGEYKHGDSCPECGSMLTNKRYTMGPPMFVGCRNRHAFDLPPREEMVEVDPEEFWGGVEPSAPSGPEHTCNLTLKKPDDDGWARRNRNRCKACSAEFDAELDAEVGFMPSAPQKVEIPEIVSSAEFMGLIRKSSPENLPPGKVFDLLRNLWRKDLRRHHKGGDFGTGRPTGISQSDSPLMAFIKALRDEGVSVDDAGLGRRRPRESCGFNHTCFGHPSRAAWSLPLPDPQATPRQGRRGNTLFKYDLKNTFVWPVSGLNGFEPKADAKDYILSKMKCPACRNEVSPVGTSFEVDFETPPNEEPFHDTVVERCPNTVSSEYGKYKPFCTEHLGKEEDAGSDVPGYPSLLKSRHGGAGLPDAPPAENWKDTALKWRDTTAKALKVGDEVGMVTKTGNKMMGKAGTGQLVGELVEIDTEMEDRSHRVKWRNPKAALTPFSYVDPKQLDLL